MPDDTVHDAAIKLTSGAGNVYLYGKCDLPTTGSDLYNKYKRTLTRNELNAELRNLGIRMALGKEQYDRAELKALDIKSHFLYVALGQLLPAGVPVIPPKNVQRVSCVGAAKKTARLLDYACLSAVYAVEIPLELQKLYLVHAAGDVPDDEMLDASGVVSVQGIVTHGSVALFPQTSPKQPVPLGRLFQRMHASADVPYVWLNDPAAPHRIYGPSRDAKINPMRGLSCEFDDGTLVHFMDDASVGIAFNVQATSERALTDYVRGRVNPLIHLVNNALQYGGPLETDAAAIRNKINSAAFSEDPFRLFQCLEACSKVQLTAVFAFPPQTMLPMFIPPYLWCAFTNEATPKYRRCPEPKALRVEHKLNATEITVFHLPHWRYLPSVARCLHLLTNSESVGERYTDETEIVPEEVVHAVSFSKIRLRSIWEDLALSDYVLQGTMDGGVILQSRSSRKACFVPVDATGVAGKRMEGWRPRLSAEETRGFLTEMAGFFAGAAPTYLEFENGFVVGIGTESGTVVPCCKSRSRDDFARFRDAVKELLCPQEKASNIWNHLHRKEWMRSFLKTAMANRVAFVQFPDYSSTPPYVIANVALFAAERESGYVERLVDELSRQHHVRCYVLGLVKRVNGLAYDVFVGEQLLVPANENGIIPEGVPDKNGIIPEGVPDKNGIIPEGVPDKV